MDPKRHATSDATLRSAATVMRLERLGSLHQSRLSFTRTLLRRMGREGWTFDRPEFDIDRKGVGVALYRAHGPERSYTLVCFAHDLPPEQRSDRVIATAWDATFTLFDGTPTAQDLQRLAANVPLQEAGRISESEIILSRANRSVRLFEHVVECLAAGRQPDIEQLEAVGYLMRTTAVYGSGKFGAAVRESIAGRAEFSAPFQAEMLSVYLIRAFTIDLAEHLARIRSPSGATRIEPSRRRKIGVGNSTGLGLAPFIVNHPMLLNNWIAARDTRAGPRARLGRRRSRRACHLSRHADARAAKCGKLALRTSFAGAQGRCVAKRFGTPRRAPEKRRIGGRRSLGSALPMG